MNLTLGLEGVNGIDAEMESIADSEFCLSEEGVEPLLNDDGDERREVFIFLLLKFLTTSPPLTALMYFFLLDTAFVLALLIE